jgi:transposase-like protein
MANGKDRDGQREARWRRIIGDQGRSGLSIREFCRRGKLTETAFYFWRSELRRRQAEHVSGVAVAKPQGQRRPDPPAVPAFVPVRVADRVGGPANGRIEIELSGGRRVHVAAPVDRQALADVLAVLEGQPC